MSKKIRSVWRLLLGSFITLLGFTACKTSKKAQQEDSAVVLYGPPPAKVEKPNREFEMKLLYGAPPVKIKKVSE